MKDDKVRGQHTAVIRFIATQWPQLCNDTLRSALSPENLADIVSTTSDDQSAQEILTSHFKFLLSTLKRFLEFGLMYQHFPWRFVLVNDPAFRDQTLVAMKKEWEFLLNFEENNKANLKKWPFSCLVHVKWYAYREVMTFCAQENWKWSPKLKALVDAWFPDPVSTLGADEVFRHMRQAEVRNHSTNGQTSPIQLQSVAIKAINGRYSGYETATLGPRDYGGIAPGAFVKKGIFDPSRGTASDTHLPSFNAMAKKDTMHPHSISRKALNLWQILQQTGGTNRFLLQVRF